MYKFYQKSLGIVAGAASAFGLAGILLTEPANAQTRSLDGQVAKAAVVQQYQNPLQEFADFMKEVQRKYQNLDNSKGDMEFSNGNIKISSNGSVTVDKGEFIYSLNKGNDGSYSFEISSYKPPRKNGVPGEARYTTAFKIRSDYVILDCTVESLHFGGTAHFASAFTLPCSFDGKNPNEMPERKRELETAFSALLKE